MHHNTMSLIFPGYIRGLEKIWIVCDNFCNHTYDSHYKNITIPKDAEHAMYAFRNFEVREYSNNRYDSLFRNTAGRIRNCLIKAINEHSALPKFIVVVLDDDLTANLHLDIDPDFQLHTITAWLATEFHKAITSYKDMIPSKAKKSFQPSFLWILPPTHKYFGRDNNDLRIAQDDCIKEIAKTKEGMTALEILKIWSYEDHNLFLEDSYHFTSEGLDNYWASVDAAIRYYETIVLPEMAMKAAKPIQHPRCNKASNDKLHWHRQLKFYTKSLHRNFQHSHCLPTPP